MIYRKRIAAIVIAAIVAGSGAVFWFSGEDDRQLLRAGNATIVADGEAVYAQQCASCHGVDLRGQPDWKSPSADGLMPAPPHDETGHTWHHDDATLFRLTKLGPAAIVGNNYKSAMPGFSDTLSDDQIVGVLSYIKSTWPAELQERHDMINEARTQ